MGEYATNITAQAGADSALTGLTITELQRLD